LNTDEGVNFKEIYQGIKTVKQVILGTAGHIDHGKTSLIKAISGYDTDRLKEEKQRGITIELGFAALDLPSGTHIGIVDVPGHEKFVKNMVAGASGIDVVAMIIAADEGIMPQTREHFEICKLLGISHGIIVLTKTDLVDEEWLEMVTEDIREFLQQTFLRDSPIIPVSSVTGDGVSEFIAELDRFCSELPDRIYSNLFRLPADRVFTMKGFGTVITGTLISGKVSAGETVMIYPSKTKSKIRGLQVHDKQVNEAEAGMRTAINFQGIEKASINRGDVIALPDSLQNSYMLDVELISLKSNDRPIKNREHVRFHTGTSEISCNIILLDREILEPGDTAIVQLRLDLPVACVGEDRFVLRSYSPVRTLGGGRILNPIPQKHKRFKNDINSSLQELLSSDPETRILQHTKNAGFSEITFTDLKIMTNLTGRPLENTLQELLSKKKIIKTDKDQNRYIHSDVYKSFTEKIIAGLSEYHKNNPLKGGMPKGELRSHFPSKASDKLLNQLLNMIIRDDGIRQAENTIRLPGHKVTLKADQSDLKDKILNIFSKNGLQPPTFKDMVKTFNVNPIELKNVLMLLVSENLIVKVKEDLFFHADPITDLKQRLVNFLKSSKEINTPQFKEMTGVSRKYTIPLLEYFDAENITIRVGDTRKLRRAE